jgi:hypothetical protein
MLLNVLLIVLLEIVFTLVLSFFAGVFALLQVTLGVSQTLITLTTTTFISVFSTYLAMFVLRKRFVIKDVKLVPLWLALVALGWGIISAVSGGSISESYVNIAVEPAIQYLVAYLFLRSRFNTN